MIDDDEDDRDIFRDALTKCNPDIQLFFAVDGVEALEILADMLTPDVIFLDYNMPRMNGLECLKELKGNRSTKDIPVVMYTTSGTRKDERAIRLMGANYYMQKTTSFEQLCTELKRLLAEIAQFSLRNKANISH